MKISFLLLAGLVSSLSYAAPKPKTYELKSPNGAIVVHITVDEHVCWSVDHKGQPVILPSDIGMQLGDGTTLGDNASVLKAISRLTA